MSISSTNKPVAVNSMKTLASQVVAYHFCQSDNAPSCLIPEFIHRYFFKIARSARASRTRFSCFAVVVFLVIVVVIVVLIVVVM